MKTIYNTSVLRTKLTRLASICAPGVSRKVMAAEIYALADQLQKEAENKDNSWGSGYYPLPQELKNLGRFSDALKVSNLLDFKYFPNTGEFMLDTKLSKLSVMALDLKSLLNLGLTRIQSNNPGVVSFYFEGFKGVQPMSGPQRI